MYKHIFVVRSRIEYLESLFFPTNVFNPTDRRARWKIILNCGDPRVEPLLDRIIKKFYPRDERTAINWFSEAIQQVFGDLCAMPYNVVDNEYLKKLTENPDEIDKILTMMGIQCDSSNQKVLQIIAEKLELPKESDLNVRHPGNSISHGEKYQ